MEAAVGHVAKKICLYVLMGCLAISLIGCGPLTEDEEATAVLTDDFSTYSSGFPSSPWSVKSGDSSNWTITSSSDAYAACLSSTSAVSSYLLNADFSEAGNTTVSARIKIASMGSSGGSYGLYLRAASDLSSYYAVVFDSANNKVQIYRVENGTLPQGVSVTWSVSTFMTSYYTYKFKVYENADSTLTLSAYANGALVASYTDAAPLTSGYETGFFFTNILEGYISHYQITQP